MNDGPGQALKLAVGGTYVQTQLGSAVASFQAHQLIDNLQHEFEIAAKSYFKFNARDKIEFEGGLYGYLIAKPIKRLAAALDVDRELLILLTSFPDQQPRTIEVALLLLARAELRVEPNVLLIAHPDQRGNAKLKDWGVRLELPFFPYTTGETVFPPARISKACSHTNSTHTILLMSRVQ